MEIEMKSDLPGGKPKEVSEVDKYIKMKIVGDAYNMMLAHKAKGRDGRAAKRNRIDQFGCWHKLETE